MGGSGGGSNTTTTDVPPWAKPYYESLYSSAFGAGRTAAGQQGYPQTYQGSTPWAGYTPPYQAAQMGGATQPQGGQTQIPNMNQGQPGGAYQGAPSGNMTPGQQYWAQQNGPQMGEQAPVAGGSIIGPSFQGPFTAPPSALEQQGLQQKAQFGQSLQGVEQGLLGTGLAQAGGAFLHPSSNPYLQGAQNAALSPVYSAFEQYAPQARSQALQSGAYKGSSRRDLLESNLQSELQKNVGNVTSQMQMQNYANERQLQQNAGTMLDQAIRLGQVSPELMMAAGGGMRGLEQMGIEERLRAYEESLAAPFRPAMTLAQIIRGQPVGQQTTQNYGQGGLGGGIIGALGGAAGGAAIGGALPGNYTGLGAGAGAVLGGLGGALA